MKSLSVIIGGAIGAYLRFACQNWAMGRWGIIFPYGTLLVNISGAFLMGFVMTILLNHLHVASAWRLFLVTGILGGYTTFSALAWEGYSLFADGSLWPAVTYLGGSFLGGALAVTLGVFIGRFF